MKKIIKLLIIWLFCAPLFAANTANIKFNIQGGQGYFLCFPDLGCLAITAKRIYPIDHRINLGNIFLIRKSDHLMVPQASDSCRVTVQRNQTVIISGNIKPGSPHINHLSCRIH